MDNKIYDKLANVQLNLLHRELPKSGLNRFANFKYFELKDIIGPIIEECYKEGLVLTFSFMDDYAVLKLRDTSNGELIECNRVAVPEIREMNKGMNILQSYGSYMTYLKRYLLLNTFLLDEDSFIDSESETKESKISSPKKESKVKRDKKYSPEKQRVTMDTSNVTVKKFQNPSEYIAFFESELIKEGYKVSKQNLFKKCTEQRLVNKDFKPLEKQVRKLIIERYGGK